MKEMKEPDELQVKRVDDALYRENNDDNSGAGGISRGCASRGPNGLVFSVSSLIFFALPAVYRGAT